eukprot:5640446-Amphidinium_carterae.2
MKGLAASSKKTLSSQAAVCIAGNDFYRIKMDMYLRDLPFYLEHSNALQEARVVLARQIDVNIADLTSVLAIMKKMPLWRQSLRNGTLEPLETDVVAKVDLVGKQINEKTDPSLVSVAAEIASEATIIYPSNPNIHQLQVQLASLMVKQSQADACSKVKTRSNSIVEAGEEQDCMQLCGAIGELFEQQKLVIGKYVDASVKEVWGKSLLPLVVSVVTKHCSSKQAMAQNCKLELQKVEVWLQNLPDFLQLEEVHFVQECLTNVIGVYLAKHVEATEVGAQVQRLANTQACLVKLEAKCLASKKKDGSDESDGCKYLHTFEEFLAQALDEKLCVCRALCESRREKLQQHVEALEGFYKQAYDEWCHATFNAKSFTDLIKIAKQTILTLNPDEADAKTDILQKEPC